MLEEVQPGMKSLLSTNQVRLEWHIFFEYERKQSCLAHISIFVSPENMDVLRFQLLDSDTLSDDTLGWWVISPHIVLHVLRK